MAVRPPATDTAQIVNEGVQSDVRHDTLHDNPVVCFLSDSTLDARTLRGLRALYRLDLWDHRDFLDERQLWDLSCLCHDLHPWGLDCLLHDVHLWNLCDHNNGDIDHLISVLQLGNLYGLLNHLVHVGLSLRQDGDVNGLVYEL